ncbi:Methionyl-tRNA formyltransferase [Trichinella spiralis]|uniref:Methionyl-tRNA formyltransferase n=1 Tax=Trichinella spiralis TaxID=6334 RepID=A0ABR3KAT1_TRISP
MVSKYANATLKTIVISAQQGQKGQLNDHENTKTFQITEKKDNVNIRNIFRPQQEEQPVEGEPMNHDRASRKTTWNSRLGLNTQTWMWQRQIYGCIQGKCHPIRTKLLP